MLGLIIAHVVPILTFIWGYYAGFKERSKQQDEYENFVNRYK